LYQFINDTSQSSEQRELGVVGRLTITRNLLRSLSFERIFKIAQHLAKLCWKVDCL